MLRVTIEVVPKGDENRRRHLGTVEIANEGTGSTELGNYAVRLAKFGRPQQHWMKGAVRGFDRLRRGPYDLLLQCLIATVGNRNRTLLREMEDEFGRESCRSQDV
jgi:hypothetical protein